jgi:hypothetical protein
LSDDHLNRISFPTPTPTRVQWRVKHRRRLNRLRGKAAALSLSTQEWKAKR